MFTRTSNFTYGIYRIANIDVDSINNNVELILHIQKYENEFLRRFLGECLYSDLLENLETDTDGHYKVKGTAEDKYKWLVNGYQYDSCYPGTECGKKNWQGLIRKIAKIGEKEIFETIMASYVFFNWSLANRTISTGSGESKESKQGYTLESTRDKRVDSWNKMVQEVSYGFGASDVSLFQFLDDFSADFPTSERVCLNTMTYYDI